MSRAVTADHVMFEECISFFRPEKKEGKVNSDCTENLKGYILLDFELNQSFEFEDFKILPTIRVSFPSPYSAFIAPVILPHWLKDRHNAHLFCIALGTIISFVTSRPVKMLRDDYLFGKDLDEYSIQTLAIQFPVLTAGPGNHDYRLSIEQTEEYYHELKNTINILNKTPYKVYVQFMRAIRLAHLAHNCKRDDFSLAYYLLVSSIEVVMQKATKVPKVKHELENQWNELAKSNQTINELFSEYKKLRNNEKHLRERFVEFIFMFCPPMEWKKVKHPQEHILSAYLPEEREQWRWVTEKRWDEIYPEDLEDKLLKVIISDSYKYRSNFTHAGSPPPHKQPNSNNRFFDVEHTFKEKNGEYDYKQVILINFNLLSFIARNSILSYAESKVIN